MHFPFSYKAYTRSKPLGYDPAYMPYTLVGPTITRPVQDPLVVLRLENQLFILLYQGPRTLITKKCFVHIIRRYVFLQFGSPDWALGPSTILLTST